MVHALCETTEPYYPDRSHAPTDFNDYVMPGPGDIARTTSRFWSVPHPTARSAARDRARCAQTRCCRPSPMRCSTRSACASTSCRSRPRRCCAASRARRRAAAGAASRGRVMAVRSNIVGIDSPDRLANALRDAHYLADDGLATAAYLALALGKPLLLEGSPGVGKTEAAKALASRARTRSRPAAMLRRHRRRGTRSTNGTIRGRCSRSVRPATRYDRHLCATSF